MSAEPTLKLIEDLVAIPSVTQAEGCVTQFVGELLQRSGFTVERFPVTTGRDNIFSAVGTPRIVFTTHLDVVPAPEGLFTPCWKGDRLYGRGSCDAKGIAACMIDTARELLRLGESDFGVLFLVGEEVDGDGARRAALDLRGRGIECLINGEPTEGKVAVAHKGVLSLKIVARGKSAHSGYPEFGDDANAKIVRCVSQLIHGDLGQENELGRNTVTVGTFGGGSAINVVSDFAWATLTFRTVVEPEQLLAQVQPIIEAECEIEKIRTAALCRMREIPGLESTVVSYSTDLPYLSALGADLVLYGPGSILRAHTDEEYITIGEVEQALRDFPHIFRSLRG